MKYIVAIICVCTIGIDMYAQIEPKHTFTIELGMPVPVANQSFRVMSGIVALSPYYQYRLPNSLTFGAGLNFHYLQINKTKVPSSEPAVGGMYSGGVFLKVGHEKFHNERFATDIGMKVGYSQTYFDTDFNDSIYGAPQKTNSITISPTLGLILNVDEFSSYRLTIGYAFQGFGFSPQRLGISTNSSYLNGVVYDPATFNNPTQYFIFGFGFTHYFSKNKNTGE